MKVYIAAPWIHKEAARAASKLIEDLGWLVTEKWWDHVDVNGCADKDAEELLDQARRDIKGVERADVLLLLNLSKSEGKAVEQGIAIASGVPIVGVGTRGEHSLNVFHFLPDYTWFTTVEEAVNALANCTVGTEGISSRYRSSRLLP